MMRVFLIGCSASLLMLAPASAQIRKFPYEGVVESDSAYVRSGPGKQFYPTARLDRGTRVTVHRHDPGGWYMVAALPSSFSWVRAEYVKKEGNGRGLITENNVVVRVGSSFGDETREVEQVRLSRNDQVEILEEKSLETSSGPKSYYKISPPAGEYRWISGKFVTPVDQIAKKQNKQQNNRDPFAVPSGAKQPKLEKAPETPPEKRPENIAQNPPNVFESSQSESSGEQAVRRRGPDPAVLSAQRNRLENLDREFRDMVNGRTQDWSFTQLEQGYRQLQEDAALPALANQIDLRFAAIERYREIKKEFDDLMRLTSETKARDARLMSIQKQQSAPAPKNQPTPVEEGPLVPQPDPGAQRPENNRGPVQLPGVEPVPGNIPQNRQAPPSGNRPAQPRRSRRVPQFDGAGIVQRAATAGTGTPAYVLITPQGRVLAYLQPVQGLDLEPYVGKAMGIIGQRSYQPELRLDRIIVRSLTPVRLAP